jgi:hypothetical protein
VKSHKARAAPAVNKELFKKSKEDTEEKVINCDRIVIFYVSKHSLKCVGLQILLRY